MPFSMPFTKNIIVVVSIALLLLCEGSSGDISGPFRRVFQQLTLSDSLPGGLISKIVETNDGRLWIITGEGLSLYDGGSFRNIPVGLGPGKLPSQFFREIVSGPGQEIWVASGGWGVFRLDYIELTDEYSVTVFDASNGLSNLFAKSLVVGLGGRIWVGTNGGVSSRLENQNFVKGIQSSPLLSSSVDTMAGDNLGNIWVGIQRQRENQEYIGEVLIMNPFTNEVNRPGLMVPGHINVIYEDDREGIWIGGGKELLHYRNGKIVPLAEPLKDLPEMICVHSLKIAKGSYGLEPKIISQFMIRKLFRYTRSKMAWCQTT
jgi:ligand-binding sensor domain-containing protein